MGNVIGCIDLYNYDSVDRRASIGILIDKKYRSKGYGSEAIKLMKDYAFKRLGIHQLHCSVPINNHLSLRLFKIAGFDKIGVKKDWIFRNGSFVDIVEFQFFNK